MACLIYLLRHGVAEDPSAAATDAERALTRDGIRKTKLVGLGMLELGLRPEEVLSSPLRRAEETARLVAGVLEPRPGVTLFPPLAPGHAPSEVVGALRPYAGRSEVLLVGHQPDLGEIASYLLTGSPTLVPLPFRKAGLAAVSVAALPPKKPGTLEWFLTPAQLRAIGAARKS